MHRGIQKALYDQSGAALLEAAIAFPMLIAVAFGVIDFSNYYYQHQAVVTGVRDAARYLARSSCATANPSASPATACSAQIGYAEQIAVYGDIGGANPRVANWTTAAISVAFGATANSVDATTGNTTYRGGNTIYTVTVSATFAYAEIGFLNMLHLTNPNFSVAHTERVIGG
jgi:Flp pilus assembly protein TadG